MLPPKRIPRIALAKSAGRGFLLFAALSAAAQVGPPEVLRFAPPSGPEGTRVEVSGKNLTAVSAVLFGATAAAFQLVSPEKVVAIVPHRVFEFEHRGGHSTGERRQPISVRGYERSTSSG